MDKCQHLTRGCAASTLTIPANGLACLDDARGLTLRVVCGSVWITEEGSIADVCLAAGESFTVTRDAMTIVAAFRPSPFARVRIEGAPAAEPGVAERMRGWCMARLAAWSVATVASR